MTRHYSLTTRLFISTMITMIFMCLTNTFTGMFDSFVISKYIGVNGIAAKSLIGTIDKLFIGLAQLVGLGAQLVISKYISKGEKNKANIAFNTMFIICIIIGFVFSVIGICLSKYITIGLSAGKQIDKVVLNLASNYLKGYFVGLPFLFLNQLLIPVIYLDGGKRRTQISILSIIVICCCCDIIVVLFSQYKMFGVGLAGALSGFASFVILFSRLFTKKSSFHLRLKNINISEFKDVLINGSPMGLKYISVTLKLYIFSIIILTVGNITGQAKTALAARGAQESISVLFESTCNAIGLTVVTLASVFFNEDNRYELDKLFKNLLKYIFLVCYTLAIIYFACAKHLAIAFLPKKAEQKLIDLTVFGMRCGSITLFFLPFNLMFLGYLQSMRRVKHAYAATILQSLILPISCLSTFGFTLGVKGIFIGYMVSTMLYIPIHLCVSTILNKKFPKTIIDLFYLKHNALSLDQKNEHYEINNIDSNGEILSKINLFFGEKSDEAYCCSRIVNTILNGYYQNNIKRSVILTVDFINRKKIKIIRLRDNCLKCDIFYESNKNILSDKMLKKIKGVKVKYTYVLKTNVYVFKKNI